MGWKRKTLIGTVAAISLTYAGLTYVTREPDRPVTRIEPGGKLLLAGVTVVDPATGTLTPAQNVLIDKGRILSVGTDAPADTDVQRVNATGKFLVPGFNDMHAHPLGPVDPSGDLALMLANGVTGFRQMSGSDTMLDERRESKLPLTLDAPAVLAMPGALLTPMNASKPDQVRATVRDEKARGADFIKVGFVSGPVLFAALDEGRKLGIPVAGHVPPGVGVVTAAQHGMHSIEHLGPANGLLIACAKNGDGILADVHAKTEFPEIPAIKSHILEKLAEWALLKRVVNPAAAAHEAGGVAPMRAALNGFDEPTCRAAMQKLKAAGNWQVPTLIRLKAIYTADDPAFARDPNLRFMPPATVETWREVTADFKKIYAPADRATMRQGYAASLRLVKLLDEEGVPMLAGSDASGGGWEIPGFALHQEFDELASAGLSPLRILQMTTSDAAAFMGRTATMGSVAPGKIADLVLLDGDPTKDVRNLHRIAGVVRAGLYRDAVQLAALKERVAKGKGYLR
jgi:imidazolonepropionase-like amidohydrolase